VLLSAGVDRTERRRTTPWREEGARERGVVAWLRPVRRRVLVGLLLGVLALNWYVSSKVTQKEEPTTVPYTVFRSEVKGATKITLTPSARFSWAVSNRQV